VIVVMMGDKNGAHIADIDASFRKLPGDAIAGINDIKRPVDNQEIGCLRTIRAQDRTT
jgi:hypothetical protein